MGKAQGRHQDKRLTAVAVRTLGPGFHADGQGLYLKVEPNGSRRWVQRIVIHGKRHDLGLGSPDAGVSLAKARAKAVANREMARSGGDPLQAKREAKAALTFKQAAERVHELHKPTWRNPKHADQWINTLKEYVFPIFGGRMVAQVTSADVLAALMPIWNEKPETARRVRQRIGTVMKWAVAQGWRLDNPAEAITKALPRHDRTQEHHAALPYADVGETVGRVQGSAAGLATKLAFEFLVLTACRSGEVRLARWDEINLDRAEWVIPGARMKAKKPHRVPLSPRALAVLREAEKLKDDTGLVFPGTVHGKPLSDMTLSKLLRELGIPAVPHGFRSSFRDWAGDQTNFPREVAEFALAHVTKDKAEAAYARSDLFEKRRKLMDSWASYLTSRRSEIVAFRAGA